MRFPVKLAVAALAIAAARIAVARQGWWRFPAQRSPRARPALGTSELPAPVLEIDGIPVYAEGAGAQVVLMLHGWPDSCRLWDAQVAALGQHHRCVRFTLPGFDTGRGPRPLSLVQTVALIGRIADAVSPGRPVVLLLHDWGCAYGYQFALTHPSRVSRIVGVDVGDAGSRAHARSLTLADKVMIAAYQWWLAAAWRISGASGDAMTRAMARLAGAPGTAAAIGYTMDYPYYLLWTGAYAEFQKRMRHFEPPCPMLYIFGRRKPFQFHSPSWAAKLAARPGHRVVGMNTGHWPMLEQPARFNEAVTSWLLEGSMPLH